jgi:hypothetical protein
MTLRIAIRIRSGMDFQFDTPRLSIRTPRIVNSDPSELKSGPPHFDWTLNPIEQLVVMESNYTPPIDDFDWSLQSSIERFNWMLISDQKN